MTRPLPREGTSLTLRLGIAGYALLAAGVPACFGLVIGPLTRESMDAFVVGLWAALILGTPLMVLTTVAVVKRPGWWRSWVAASGYALLVGWIGALIVGLGYPLGLVHPHADASGSLAPMGWTGLVFLVALSPAAWLVVRMLGDPAVRRAG